MGASDPQKNRKLAIVALCLMLLLVGCQIPNINVLDQTQAPTPTLNPVFFPIPTATIAVRTATSVPTLSNTPTPVDTGEADITPEGDESTCLDCTEEPSAERTPPTPHDASQVIEVPIYDDQTDSNWILRANPGASYIFQAPEFVHDGKFAISITFLKDDNYFDFIVRQGAPTEFLRKDTYGVRFWLYSNDQPLALDDIGIGIYGSNNVNYMTLNDSSVDLTEFDPSFGDDSAYLLGLNRAIPANTWTEIEISLDDLTYDTDYAYVTGVRFRNNADFNGTITIDNLSLLQYPAAE